MFTCQNRKLGRWHGLWTSSSSAEPAPTEVVPEAMPDASTVGCIRIRIMKTWMMKNRNWETKIGSLGIGFSNSLDLWTLSAWLMFLRCFTWALTISQNLQISTGQICSKSKKKQTQQIGSAKPSSSNLRYWLPLLFELFSSITCNHARLIEARF